MESLDISYLPEHEGVGFGQFFEYEGAGDCETGRLVRMSDIPSK